MAIHGLMEGCVKRKKSISIAKKRWVEYRDGQRSKKQVESVEYMFKEI